MSHIAEPRPCSSSLTRSPSVSFLAGVFLSLSRSLALSHSLPVATPRARAKQEASTRSGIHCVSMTRFITAGTLHVSEALLDPESRGWMPFWLKRLLSHTPTLSSTRVLQSRHVCVYLCRSPQKKLQWHHPKASH